MCVVNANAFNGKKENLFEKCLCFSRSIVTSTRNIYMLCFAHNLLIFRTFNEKFMIHICNFSLCCLPAGPLYNVHISDQDNFLYKRYLSACHSKFDHFFSILHVHLFDVCDYESGSVK